MGIILQMYVLINTKRLVEDALDLSNLASAVIDIEEYGTNHNIIISNPDQAYLIYKNALKSNMGLDNEQNCTKYNTISGKVTVLEYIIYNVYDNVITVHRYNADGTKEIEENLGYVGNIQTPDNTVVESTTVYSRIGFHVKLLFNMEFYGVHDNSADIVKEYEDKHD